MLRTALICTLLSLAACVPDDAIDGPTSPPDPAGPETNKQVESPPTGIPRIQAEHDEYSKDIAGFEKALAPDRAPDEHQVRMLKGLRQGIDNLILATKLGRDADAEQGARSRHAKLRIDFTAVLKQRRELWREITEVDSLVKGIEKGTAQPPAGFTEPELRDKLADLRAEDDKLVASEEEIRKKMKVEEDLLKLETVPATEKTLFTEELAALEKLRDRVDALLNRRG